jgi:hypothetical protein
MHTSHKHTTPTHHAACKSHMCKFTVCIQDVFMCMLLVFAACMMAIFMHGACACATTCMWHIGMPGRVYSASALHVTKLSYYIECKISLNYIVHNVKSGKLFNLMSALM